MADLDNEFEEVETETTDPIDPTEIPGDEFHPEPEKVEEEEEPSEEKTEEPAAEAKDEKVEDKVETKAEEENEVLSLRALVRSQHKALQELRNSVSKHEKSLSDNKLLDTADPDEEGKTKKPDQSNARVDHLTNVLTYMELNPKYEDVREVVSQKNFDETVYLLAKNYVDEKGGDIMETIDQLEQYIWSQDNPYKLMYDRIKDVHPAYKKAAATPEEILSGGKPKAETKPNAKKRETPEAPASLGVLPAGDIGSSGWTAKAIDDLPEDRLGEIPAKIYSAYLRGELK